MQKVDVKATIKVELIECSVLTDVHDVDFGKKRKNLLMMRTDPLQV